MSGIEVAGLALTVVPFLVDTIQKLYDLRLYTLRLYEIYGPLGVLVPLLCSSDAWRLADKILKTQDDKTALDFVAAQIAQANMVAVTGAIMAQVAITALTLDYLSTAHWVARAFFLASLLAGCASVYNAMCQLRVFGRLITARDVRAWLRGPPRKIKEKRKNVPSAAAVLMMDTPRGLVDMAAASFICGLSVYVVFIFINDLDVNAGKNDSRNIVIAYFASMWLCATHYNRSFVFDIYVGSTPTWKEFAHILGLNEGPAPVPDDEDADPEHGQVNTSSITPTNRNLSYQQELSSVSNIAGKGEPAQVASIIRPFTENRHVPYGLQGDHPAPAEVSSLSRALQDTIAARRRCLEADQRLLALLECQEMAFDPEDNPPNTL